MGRAGLTQVDGYIISYNLDLWSNFTFFLDNPTQGDQFQQTDRRMVYGLIPSYTGANKLGGAEMTNTVGVQIRYDDINKVGAVFDAGAPDLEHDEPEQVGELAAGIYGQNADAVEQLVSLADRIALRLLQLQRAE